MTKKTNETEQTRSNNEAKLPKYVVKMRDGYGKNATYERIGVAWENDDGSLYVKLHGRQIVERGFTLYAMQPAEKAAA
jgi:hypothetical protein